MSKKIELSAVKRTEIGKGASRRLRRNEYVPGILYGDNQSPFNISIKHNDIAKAAQQENFFSTVLNLNLDGDNTKVVVKDIQRHPFRPVIIHADFLRVSAKTKLVMTVPIHFIGEADAPGVKVDHGIFIHTMTELEIKCLPNDLPEYIEVNVSQLGVGKGIHLSEIILPKGVELAAAIQDEAHDPLVVSIQMPREAEEEKTAAAPAAGETPAAGTAGSGTPAASANPKAKE